MRFVGSCRAIRSSPSCWHAVILLCCCFWCQGRSISTLDCRMVSSCSLICGAPPSDRHDASAVWQAVKIHVQCAAHESLISEEAVGHTPGWWIRHLHAQAIRSGRFLKRGPDVLFSRSGGMLYPATLLLYFAYRSTLCIVVGCLLQQILFVIAVMLLHEYIAWNRGLDRRMLAPARQWQEECKSKESGSKSSISIFSPALAFFALEVASA